jgi:hypothetical protein
MLKCKDCGNTDSFYVGAIEYHTWEIDGNKNFISDVDNTDSKMADDFCCKKCDSWEIEEINDD